jgi:hypothetical protein
MIFCEKRTGVFTPVRFVLLKLDDNIAVAGGGTIQGLSAASAVVQIYPVSSQILIRLKQDHLHLGSLIVHFHNYSSLIFKTFRHSVGICKCSVDALQ